MTKVNYNLDLSQYNLVELEVFLDTGIITPDEFEAERTARHLVHTAFTPPSSRIRD